MWLKLSSAEGDAISCARVERWVEVSTLDDLWEGDLAEVQLDGEAVLLVHLEGGGIRAYQGVCPHQEQSLADGDLDGDVLTCPGHRWEFDARHGRGINPEGCVLFSYPVRVVEERILLGVPPAGTSRYYHFTATLEAL